MPVRGINSQHVSFGARHFYRAFQKISRSAHCSSHAQSTLFVLGRSRVGQFFLNIFYGDQSLEVVILVHHKQFFDAMLLQNALSFIERGSHRHGDQIVFGHHRADQLRVILFKAQITVGKNPGEPRATRNRQARNAVLGHDVERLP